MLPMVPLSDSIRVRMQDSVVLIDLEAGSLEPNLVHSGSGGETGRSVPGYCSRSTSCFHNRVFRGRPYGALRVSRLEGVFLREAQVFLKSREARFQKRRSRAVSLWPVVPSCGPAAEGRRSASP